MSVKQRSIVRFSVLAPVVLLVGLGASAFDTVVQSYCIRNISLNGINFSWRLENLPGDKTCNDPDVDTVMGDTPSQIATKWRDSINTNCTGGGSVLSADAAVLTSTEVNDLCPPGFTGGLKVSVGEGFNHFVGASMVPPPSSPCNCGGGLDPNSCEVGEQSLGLIPPPNDFCNFNPDISRGGVIVPTLGEWGLLTLAALLVLIGSTWLYLRRP